MIREKNIRWSGKNKKEKEDKGRTLLIGGMI